MNANDWVGECFKAPGCTASFSGDLAMSGQLNSLSYLGRMSMASGKIVYGNNRKNS